MGRDLMVQCRVEASLIPCLGKHRLNNFPATLLTERVLVVFVDPYCRVLLPHLTPIPPLSLPLLPLLLCVMTFINFYSLSALLTQNC